MTGTVAAESRRVLHCSIEGADAVAWQNFSLPDHAALKTITHPVYITYTDTSGEPGEVYLDIAFGTSRRVLRADWRAGSSVHSEGYSTTSLVSRSEMAVLPGQGVRFQYGSNTESKVPEISVTCTLDPNAGKYEPAPGCQGECGGGSVSN